jgi:hypothetical protein
MPTDLNQGYGEAKSDITSIKTFIEVSKSAKKVKSTAGNSESQGIPDIASGLNKIATQQKRYLRQPPNSFNQLLDMIGLANGSGSSTLDYLKKKLLQTVTKIEPDIKKIISQEAIRALGCSQEQTFEGFTSLELEITPLESLPVGQGIYIPVQSMDIASILKINVNSKLGKLIYEKPTPSVAPNIFKPYGGLKPYPMNKEFNLRLSGPNSSNSYKGQYGKYYQGISGQDLFDFQYSPTSESFFELTEVDLRNIDLRISNIQNGVMEFEDCENVKLPVDYETIIDELVGFRENDDLTTEEQVQNIVDITNTLFQNPDWDVFLPTDFNTQVAVNKNIIKQIPIAVAGSVLSPKVLFPIFVLLRVVQNDATGLYNQAVTSANTYVQSGNTILGEVNNIVNNQIDFLKTFESFNIQVTSKIGAIFIKQLFELLKKDIIMLISSVVKDIEKGRWQKKWYSVQRLTDIALIIQQIVRGVDDYRKCKSLVDDILIILKLLSGLARPDSKIPAALLLLADFLPGTSAERSTINVIKELQSFGVPTGTLPDGSPNLMLLYNLASNVGAEKEKAQNGKIQAVGMSAAGPVKISGMYT